MIMIIILLYHISYILNVVLSVFFFVAPAMRRCGGSTGGRENEDLFIREILNICNAKIFYVRCFNFSLMYLSFKYVIIIVLVSPFRFSPVLSSFPFYLSLPTPLFFTYYNSFLVCRFFLFFLELSPST